MPVRLLDATLLLEHAAERVVRVVLGRLELEERAELGLCLVPALEAEVGDAERLAFSSDTVAWAGMPLRSCARPFWKRS